MRTHHPSGPAFRNSAPSPVRSSASRNGSRLRIRPDALTACRWRNCGSASSSIRLVFVSAATREQTYFPAVGARRRGPHRAEEGRGARPRRIRTGRSRRRTAEAETPPSCRTASSGQARLPLRLRARAASAARAPRYGGASCACPQGKSVLQMWSKTAVSERLRYIAIVVLDEVLTIADPSFQCLK